MARKINRNSQVAGELAAGKFEYFKILVNYPRASVKIQLRSKRGDPDLFVGNANCPIPDKKNFTWRKTGFGDDRLVIHFFDEEFILGWMYIGVYAAGVEEILTDLPSSSSPPPSPS
eukprot:661494-Hanusia_phi.AAC.1